ncbi:hypothetical protein [Yimella sp. cx-51]|uniref:hypothetical protein n=1 Tax=Yimella sp. cx-51 TaxID=2770551 RepID=UPI00165E1BF7|nr:hypothetical protein [Yimella sp. cx-51]MBC9957454.1 hypothetical protein [Yimella sp. cx-51]QTH39310.1 hypothetical protein J5M86_06865 [Yimella sp. cx-51]
MRRPSCKLVASIGGLVIGGLVFLGTLLDFGWNPGRTANTFGFASNFFDIQARALLAGHLSVPKDALGIEGFVVDGKTYMYFPPFPAVARMPVLLVTHEFDGRLTVLMMAVAWTIFAVMTTRLVWLIRSCIVRTEQPTIGECFGVAALIAAMTGGTTLTFDAALPWVYHEVYAWSAAFFVSAAYWLVRYVQSPSRTAAWWIGAAVVGQIMTRSTGGFALAGVCLVTAGIIVLRRRRAGLSVAAPMALAGFVPLAASVTLNMVKFGHPYLFPLERQVWTTVNEHRREALAANGGTITGPQFIPSTTLAYLRPDGIRFTEYFPWISLPARPAAGIGDVVFDQTYRTGSVTAFMPLLSLLAVVALLSLPWWVRSSRTRPLAAPLAAAVLTIMPVLMYGYMTHRYTSEFVPLLVVGGAIGFWLAWRGLARVPTVLRGVFLALVASGAAASLVVQTLTAVPTIAMNQRGSKLEDYITRQLTLPGHSALKPLMTKGEAVPAGGATDSFFIQGDCDALFVNTGDAYDQWVLVEQRPLVAGLSLDERYKKGRVPLFVVHGPVDRSVQLEIGDLRLARVVVSAADGEVTGPWFSIYKGSQVRLGLGVRSDLGYADITSTPGGHVAYVPWSNYDPTTWVSRPGRIVAADSATIATQHGLTVRDLTGRPLPLCQQVLSRVK